MTGSLQQLRPFRRDVADDTITRTNGSRDEQVNDPKNLFRPASIKAETTAPTPVTLWSTGTYAFDGTGNIAQMGSSFFLYDKVSRLKKGFLYTNPLGTSLDRNQSYSFDAFGNIKDVTTQVGAATPVVRATPTSTTTNRLTGATSYDARGNLTAWNGATYRYGPFNEMFRMTNGGEDWIYIYNADDERMAALRLPLSNRFNRWTLRGLGNEVLREYYQIGEPLLWSLGGDYTYRNGSLLAADTPSGVRHFHLDHLGTPRLVTNSSGAQVAFHAYYPFGEEATAFNQDAERMKFTGHERDLNNTGGAGDDLDYMHARFHSPVTGRLMSVDPLNTSAQAGRPQSWNRYSYGWDNPAIYTDPTGRFVQGPALLALSLCQTYGLCSDDTVTVKSSAVDITPLRVGWEWVTGTGPRSRHFYDGDAFAEMLKEHQHVQNVVRGACDGSLPPQDSANYMLSGIEGVPKYFRDYSTLAIGGLAGNLAVTYLGSYDLSYSLAGNSVQLSVTNSSTVASGSRPPVLGYTPWWNNNVGNQLNKTFSSGPMSQTNQIFSLNIPCP